jgi:hypothetical protein
MEGLKYKIDVCDDRGCFDTVIDELFVKDVTINSAGYCFERENVAGPRLDQKNSQSVEKIEVLEEDYNMMKTYLNSRKQMKNLKEKYFKK